jgi:hypothetical protein
VAARVPTTTDLQLGELAINTTDGKLFLKKNVSGTESIVEIGNQTVTLSGDVSGSGSTSITATLANSGVSAGTYRSVTVDVKGRVTAGTTPTTLAGYGITDALPIAGGTLTGALAVTAGTVSAPGVAASGDSNTGIFFPAADTIAFAEGGTEAMRLDSSGNMGLGVVSPAARFDLGGDYKESVVTANTGTNYTIALTGTVQNLTLTGNCIFTFPAATTAGRSFLLILRQDVVGSRTATWPATVRWPGGTAPTITATASRYDLYAFTADGSVWLARTIAQNYAA